jgi:hypothetical protein
MAALKRDRSLKAVNDLMLPVKDMYELTGLAAFAQRETDCAAIGARLGDRRRKSA